MNENISAQDIIEQLKLEPHPEGGFYKETYRSEDVLNAKTDLRNISTAIYFLITADNFSSFHKIDSDEIFHFYLGNSVEIVCIDQSGNRNDLVLGDNLLEGELPQCIVLKNQWQALRIRKKTGYCLLGTTVAPGFDFKNFEIGQQEKLIKLFPQHEDIITQLTRA